MGLITRKLEQDGGFLFRWRSFLPLVIVPVGYAALFESVRVQALVGEGIFDTWTLLCLAVSVFGLLVRWVTVGFVPSGTSGRNTREQRATSLNTTGIYATVRNPLYLGNFLIYLGVVMLPMVWWFVAIVCLAYWLYIERIIAAEEAFLVDKFGEEYTGWAARTPVFLPKPGNWNAPPLSFSLTTVLRREYNGVAAVATAFFVVNLIMATVFMGQPLEVWLGEARFWVRLLAGSIGLFMVLWTLKKTTSLLRSDR